MNFDDMANFFETMGELDYKVDSGMEYEELYDSGYLKELKKLCNKHNINFNEKEIDWEWCNYIQQKQHEIEEKYREECEILNVMTNEEKFHFLCKSKNIDEVAMAIDIYKTIEYSDLEDTSEYIDVIRYQDEYMEEYDVDALFFDSSMLYTFDDWAKDHMQEYDISYEECKCLDWESTVIGDEFDEEQKEFIKLALQYKVEKIIIKDMP